MTTTVEFEHTLEREDHEFRVFVRAILRRMHGEPGSLAIAAGWEVDHLRAEHVDGSSAKDGISDNELDHLHQAALERAPR